MCITQTKRKKGWQALAESVHSAGDENSKGAGSRGLWTRLLQQMGHGGAVDTSMQQQLSQIFGFHHSHSDEHSQDSQDSDGSMWESEDEDGDENDTQDEDGSDGDGHGAGGVAADHNVFIVPDDDDGEEDSDYIDNEMGIDEVQYCIHCSIPDIGLYCLTLDNCSTFCYYHISHIHICTYLTNVLCVCGCK